MKIKTLLIKTVLVMLPVCSYNIRQKLNAYTQSLPISTAFGLSSKIICSSLGERLNFDDHAVSGIAEAVKVSSI